uniref:B30.2/SPRY domain-containing protein n=1 Tax=Hucho hucho TaxID=62062 RepID=A0A4W5RQZ6_9TELE
GGSPSSRTMTLSILLKQHSKRQIRGEFEKLHQFLREVEEARLAALRKEEEEKGKMIAREIKNNSGPDLFSHRKHHCCETRIDVWPHLSGALIDVAKHLGNLQFRVWEKMQGIVKYTPVILDPNTAARWLSLSDDLTSVRHLGKRQQLPDNPERNTICITVLDSEGFSSGRHSWEVEVGDHPEWYIDVAKDSGQYWAEHETLTLKRRPQRIRLQLDYDRGQVAFYDRMYPYFSIGQSDVVRL